MGQTSLVFCCLPERERERDCVRFIPYQNLTQYMIELRSKIKLEMYIKLPTIIKP